MTVLSVNGLRKSFGGVQAVSEVGFSLAKGEMLAIIGPNGAGKSTCFNMIGGQLAPDAGDIRLGDASLLGLPPRAIWRKGVGRTFQIAATFASMTVRENVQMALISHRQRLRALWPRARDLYRDEANATLARVGIANHADRTCGVLAYGDIKRVELAVALANDPRLLLMDEPTAGMAPRERAAIMKLTREIARERGVSILFTEHDMDVVFGHADRIMVLDRGRPIALGDGARIRDDPEVRRIYLGGLAIGR